MVALKPEPSAADVTPGYRPPQKLLVPCPHCGQTVLRGIALEGGRIRRCVPPLTPCFGHPHQCEEGR